MERTAQCHCGALRAIATGEPAAVVMCSCEACQRRSGSVAGFGAYFPKEAVRVEGASKVYVRTADSGNKLFFHFCPECGSNVYWLLELRPNLCGVAVGGFADPAFPAPSHSVWEGTRHGWIEAPASAQRFESNRH